jgi:hypothetical protein
MKKNELDEIFARKLREAALEPRPEAWAKLQQRMANKKDNHVVLWWQRGAWLAAASVILVSGALWWSNLTTTTKPQIAKISIPIEKIRQEPQVATINKIIEIKPTAKIGLTYKNIQVVKTTKVTDKQTIIAKQEVVLTPEKIIETPKIINELPANTIAENTVKTPETTPKIERKVLMTLPEVAETLVAENTKAEYTITDKSLAGQLPENNKKNNRFAKVFRQLKNIKEGEKVDWNEVGFDPNTVLSKVGKKI